MSLKSAKSWYARYKDSDSYKARIKRRQASWRTQGGNEFVSLKHAQPKLPRMSPLASFGFSSYKKNGVTFYL